MVVCAFLWIGLTLHHQGSSRTLESARHIVLHPHEVVMLRGPITSSRVDSLLADWRLPKVRDRMSETHRTLLLLDSPGGSVMEGQRILHQIQALQAQGIVVECVALTFMSMAFSIFQACDHRLIVDHSIGMQHPMSFGLRPDTIYHQRALMTMYDRMETEMIERESARLGIPETEYRTRVAHEWWLYGRDMLRHGVADERVTLSCDPLFFTSTDTTLCPL